MNPFEEENPFLESDEPQLPHAAKVRTPHKIDRSSRSTPFDNDQLGAYQSNRSSPNIFARSSKEAPKIFGDLNSIGTPRLEADENATPRARYTNQESPKRKRQSGFFVDTAPASPLRASEESLFDPFRASVPNKAFHGSKSTSSSERFLEPPKPIFSPETFAEANLGTYSHEIHDDEETINSTEKESLYNVKAYQKELDDETLADTNTVYSSGYTSSHSGANDEYFGTSIDKDMMQNVPDMLSSQRQKTVTKRRVRLVGGETGNFVLENRIPEELKKVLSRTESPFGEFTNMTYTACTAEPDEFLQDGFTLRPVKFGRETELVICVTMYNEDEFAFARTMHGIMKNIAHLCSRTRSSVWGKESWKKIQVILIADGRNKVNESVLQLLTATGCYQDNLARPYVNNKKVNAHLFEYTTQISIDENLKFKGDEKSLTPVQVLFCLKEKNQKKINSHRWLFNAFCPVLDPNVVVLLDVGTKPDNNAVYNLWKAFDKDSNVAGAAGEITAMKGKGWSNLINPLVASQNFEYKMSNILDKPLESLFGYISVLPGALSAYRYIALKNHADGTGPLASYFRGEDLLNSNNLKNSTVNFFEANMYLAEDRILCWELVAKRNESWVLKFVKLATGETDVPESISEFLSQRRRWINGAFFAALYSLRHSTRIWQTDHTFARKFWLCVEFSYQFLTTLLSFFSLSNFYLTFYFLTGALLNQKGLGKGGFWIFTIFNYLCICTLTSLFVASIGNRPQASRNIFKALIISLTVCALYALIVGFCFVAQTIKQFNAGDSSEYVFIGVVVSLLATYGLYTIMSILYLDPWHMITCSVQYFLMIPSYTCTLQIFAFCNTHDVSWGTKGDNNPKDDKSNQYIIQQNEEGEFEVIVQDYNIDEVYLETLYNIRAKRSNKKVHRDFVTPHEIDGEDYAKDVRTKVVLVWLLSNLIFIMIMLQVYKPGQTSQNYYLAFILWTVAAVAVFRAVGSTGYLAQKMARWAVVTVSKWNHKREGYKETNLNGLNR